MSQHLSSSDSHYYDLYRGKTLVIKASGKELIPEKIQALAHDIRELIARGIYVVLIYGGGVQIDEHWSKNHNKPRPKQNGVGITTSEVLFDAVKPAYTSVRDKIEGLIPELQVVSPESVQCDIDASKGLVGIPKNVSLENIKNTAFGFVGANEHQALNVNADDVVDCIVRQYADEINEVIILTETGGVLDNDQLVPIVLSSGILEDGAHSKIEVIGGMKKKLSSIRAMLPVTGKVAMTRSENLKDEITQWRGSGTLCVDVHQVECGPMQTAEEGIFRSVYEEYVAKGIFRKRTDDALQELLDHHQIMRIKNSPLGGFSLVPRDEDWLELCALWSGYLGNGMGSILSDHWKEKFNQSKASKLYALGTPKNSVEEKKIIRRFTSYGMQLAGRLQDVQHFVTDLPRELREYNTYERNPFLFYLKD